MWKNYLKIALRSLRKHKIYAGLNIMGLATGIASFVLIVLYINDETSYDRHYNKSDQTYRVVQTIKMAGAIENSSSCPFPVAEALQKAYPEEIETVTRLFNFQAPKNMVRVEEKNFSEKNMFFVDSGFVELFDVKVLKGDISGWKQHARQVIITEATATRYFGDIDPIGREIRFENRMPLFVSAVIENPRSQSHFQYDLLASFSTLKDFFGGNIPNSWVWNPCWTYISLKDGVDPQLMNEKLPAFVNDHFASADKDNNVLHLQKLTEIHLNSDLDYEIRPNGHMGSLYILGLIAIFVLFIAIINFTNLSTAGSAGRAREIGVKKVYGASRKQLIVQFLGESILISLFSLLIAMVMVESSLSIFNTFTGKSIQLLELFSWSNFVLLLSLGIIIGILAGIYPAFYLSSFRPTRILKGNLLGLGNSGLGRKILVVTQFAISISLIIGTLIIFKQLSYLRQANLGFNKDQVLILPINNTPILRNLEVFRNALKESPDVKEVTAMDYIIGTHHNNHEFHPEGLAADKWHFYPTLIVYYDFLKTFDIDIVAGRDYDRAIITDRKDAILINESMVRHMGWETNEMALGKQFSSLLGEEKIVGVFEDFHVNSLHSEIEPLVLNMKETAGAEAFHLDYMAIKSNSDDYQKLLSFVESKWEEFAPERPFEYSFLDDNINQLYNNEERLGKLTAVFSLLTIFIASLGLFGLVSFMAERRTKEIGIRKVLGATTLLIIRLLSTDFLRLILLANALAWPITYFLMTSWLENFTVRVPITGLTFLLTGLISIVLALFITSWKAYRTANQNPAKVIRYE